MTQMERYLKRLERYDEIALERYNKIFAGVSAPRPPASHPLAFRSGSMPPIEDPYVAELLNEIISDIHAMVFHSPS